MVERRRAWGPDAPVRDTEEEAIMEIYRRLRPGEPPTEDTQTKILEVTYKAGIDLSADDIVVSHKVEKTRSTGHRQIIAKLKTVDTKFRLLRNSKKLFSHSETKYVRINEDLTKFRDRPTYLYTLCNFST